MKKMKNIHSYTHTFIRQKTRGWLYACMVVWLTAYTLQLNAQTAGYNVDVAIGSTTILQWKVAGDYTGYDSLYFAVRACTTSSSCGRLVGPSKSCSVTYSKPYTTVRCTLYAANTAGFNSAKYFYSVYAYGADTVAVRSGIMNLQLNGQTSIDGIATNYPVHILAVDTSDQEPGVLISRNSNNTTDWWSIQTLKDTMGVADSSAVYDSLRAERDRRSQLNNYINDLHSMPSNLGSAIDFNGANEYLRKSSPSNVNMDSSSFTLNIWARLDSTVGRVFSQRNNSRPSIELYPISSSQYQWYWADSSQAGTKSLLINSTGIMNMFTFVVDAPNDYIYFYSNGVLVDSAGLAAYTQGFDLSGSNITIGDNFVNNSKFVGLVGEIILSKSRWYLEQIQDKYAYDITPDSIINYWYRFEGTDTTDMFRDLSGSGNDLNSVNITFQDVYNLSASDKYRNIVLFVGNSLTNGGLGVGSYPYQCITPTYFKYNLGVSGLTTQGMIDSLELVQNAFKKNAKKRIIVFWGGSNDLNISTSVSDLQSNIESYCLVRKSEGYKVIILNLLPRQSINANYETQRQTVNSWLAANYLRFSDGLADVAGNSNIGDEGDNENLTYYDADQVHPNNVGYGIVADIVETVIGGL